LDSPIKIKLVELMATMLYKGYFLSLLAKSREKLTHIIVD